MKKLMKSTTYSSNKWRSIINNTDEVVANDDSFAELSAREKLLTFYYYHLDEVNAEREFILSQFSNVCNPVRFYFHIKSYRSKFQELMKPIVEEAIQEGSLKSLPVLDQSYVKFLWLQHLFILRFWVTDDSNDFENTIALIEKAMKSTFEFMGTGALNSSIDFWKFVMQNPIKLRVNHE